jgi:hypothetical protein
MAPASPVAAKGYLRSLWNKEERRSWEIMQRSSGGGSSLAPT